MRGVGLEAHAFFILTTCLADKICLSVRCIAPQVAGPQAHHRHRPIIVGSTREAEKGSRAVSRRRRVASQRAEAEVSNQREEGEPRSPLLTTSLSSPC